MKGKNMYLKDKVNQLTRSNYLSAMTERYLSVSRIGAKQPQRYGTKASKDVIKAMEDNMETDKEFDIKYWGDK